MKTLQEEAKHYLDKGVSFRKVRAMLIGKFPDVKASDVNKAIRDWRHEEWKKQFK